MFVASFVLCAVCAGSVYVGVQFLNQKPLPADTANAFWNTLEGDSSGYSTIQGSYLSPLLRVQYTQQQFVVQATQADNDFGKVMSAVQTSQPVGDPNQSVTISYKVTRGTHNVYPVTLTLTMHAGAWGIDDMGAAINPTAGGLQAPNPTPSPSPSPTSNIGQSPIAFQRDPRASRAANAIAS